MYNVFFLLIFIGIPLLIGIGLSIGLFKMRPSVKRQFMNQLILALEDPEIRAMLYDAMQEESKLRRERKQS